MMEVWQQAKADEYAANLDTRWYEARLLYGVKIKRYRESNKIVILNTHLGGDSYTEVMVNQYNDFKEYGWRRGVYLVAIENINRKLVRAKGLLADSIANDDSKRRIQALESAVKRQENKINFYQSKFQSNE